MGTRDSFLEAWRARFPVDPPPDLECLREQNVKAQHDSAAINLEVARQEKRKFETKVLALKNELHQYEFVVGFLWELINGPTSPTAFMAKRSAAAMAHTPLLMDAPAEPPPPVPSAVSGHPDFGLDCQVPIAAEEPKRSNSNRQISQVPAYMETDLDFAVTVDTVQIEAGPSHQAPAHVSTQKSNKKGPGSDEKLDITSGGKCLHNKPNLKSIGKQQSLDSEPRNQRLTKGVSTESSIHPCSVGVSHTVKDTLELSSGDNSQAQPTTVTEPSSSGKQAKARLMRKLSADSNVSVARAQQDFESQRRSYSLGLSQDVDTKKGLFNQTTPNAGTFSTFKPAGVCASNSVTEADRKSKPTPAPRPSLVGPEYKLKTGMYVVDELSPVLEQGQRLPACDKVPNVNSMDEQIPRSSSMSQGSLGRSVPNNSLKYSESMRDSEGKVKKDRPATSKKPSIKKDNFEAAVTVPDPQITSKAPKMTIKPQNGSIISPSQEPPIQELKIINIPRSQSPLNMAKMENLVMVPKPVIKDKTMPAPGVQASQNIGEKIYEEPIPVRADKIEEASSSDDDEPVYQNLMLLKQRSMARGQTATRSRMFESMDYQKKHLHKQAERLSRRFSTAESLPAMSLTRYDQMTSIGEHGPPGMSIPPPSTDHSPSQWRKRSSMMCATGDDTASEDDLDVMVPACAETEKIQMRKFVLTSIVASERSYLLILDTLMQYMQTFKNIQGTAQSVISAEDIKVIFYKIPELHRVHFDFIKHLEPMLEKWTGEQEIANHFQDLALAECSLATDYLRNYQKAVTAIHRCTTDSERFSDLTKSISCKGTEEISSLEELLHKPVVRFQRNTLVLHDLIQFTPTSHKDYDTLQKTRKIAQNFLENFTSPVSKNNAENQRYLSKQGLVVEKVGSGTQRKLRHIFLFNDAFVCAKEKFGRQRSTFEVKWFIPLLELIIVDDRQTAQEERVLEENTKQETDKLQKKVSELQNELKQEMKKAKMASDGSRSWSFRGHKNNLEKTRKKLFEQEGMLILTAPHLIFKLKSKKSEKSYSLLLASDYERNSWKETILGLQNKPIIPGAMTNVELTNIVNSLKLPKLSSTGSIEDFELEDEALFGSLDVTIHKMYGLKTSCDVFCCMEVDSFGHFCMKAKTNIITKTSEPSWNENFDIELDGAQQLRVLCYKMGDTDTLIGKCALELGKGWLRGDFSEEAISIGESMTLVITLKYRNREQTIKRTPSSIQGGLFGVKINSVTKREGKKIPLIVTYCVEEVERRGLEDVGIYRISGLSAEITRLKKAFEKSPVGAGQMIREMDVNVVTGLLKLYFRELPESLFTDKLYNRLQEGLTLSDPEAKEKFMMTLIKSLPEPNLSTVFYMLDHLIKISKLEVKNKMSLHNLATVFGPTLLRPASKESEPVSMEQLFTAGARDAMMQTGILYFYMTNWGSKDSQNTRL